MKNFIKKSLLLSVIISSPILFAQNQYDPINKITKFLSVPDISNIHDVKMF